MIPMENGLKYVKKVILLDNSNLGATKKTYYFDGRREAMEVCQVNVIR